ncbi:VOC family protein [Rhodobiaceae bacterium]|nr:VOC family protein [Rhodobiaceae bacterium]
MGVMEKKSGPIMQMGFVVEDLDDAIDYWTKK